MHPKELSHLALVAASAARLDGFQATANAFLALAAACDDEASRENAPHRLLASERPFLCPYAAENSDLIFH
jgi:hypothetical protein